MLPPTPTARRATTLLAVVAFVLGACASGPTTTRPGPSAADRRHDARALAAEVQSLRPELDLAPAALAEVALALGRERLGHAIALTREAALLAKDGPDAADTRYATEVAAERYREAAAVLTLAADLAAPRRPALAVEASEAAADALFALGRPEAAEAVLLRTLLALDQRDPDTDDAALAHRLTARLSALTAPPATAVDDPAGAAFAAAPGSPAALPTDLAALAQAVAADPALLAQRDCAGATPLHLAAERGDLARLEVLLAAGAPLEARDAHRWTPLHRAIAGRQRAAAELLLRRGAHVATRDIDARTPLHLAALMGDAAMVRRIIAAAPPAAPAALLAARTRSRDTALHLAARGGHGAAITALAQAGARLEARDAASRTALHLAALRDQAAAVDALAAAGAALDAVDAEDLVPLHLAALANAPGALRALAAAGADLAAPAPGGLTALHLAAGQGHAVAVTALVSLHAPVEAQDATGATPLHAAVRRGTEAVVPLLLAAGAAVDARDRARQTPLHFAALFADPALASTLLAAGAAPELVDAAGHTALDRAIVARQTAVVARLADPALTREPWPDSPPVPPPLHLAVSTGAGIDVLDALLAAGFPVDAPDREGATALMVAAASGRSHLVVALLDRGADPAARDARGASAAHAAARGGSAQAALALVERHPASLVARDGRGWTPLHVAAFAPSPAVVTALLSAGADALARTPSGALPAHLAAHRGQTPLAVLLLAQTQGAPDLSLAAALGMVLRVQRAVAADPAAGVALGPTGLTPLMMAVVNGQRAVVEALLTLGVDPNTRASLEGPGPGDAGWTAFDFAEERRDEPIIALLRARQARRSGRRFDLSGHGVFIELSNDIKFLDLHRFKQINETRGAGGQLEDAASDGRVEGAEATALPADVGAEPLGIQIRERLRTLDVLDRAATLGVIDAETSDQGWDEVAARCVAAPDLDAAERALRVQLVLRRNAVRPGDAEIGLVQHNLARVLFLSGRGAEVEPLLGEALVALQQEPVVHSAALETRAEWFAVAGRSPEAEALYRAVLAVRETREHEVPAQWLDHARSGLANLLTEMGRYADAAAQFERLLASRAHGPVALLAVARNNQAVLRDLLGDHAAAAAGYEQALAALGAGGDPGVRAVVLNNLAFTRLRQHDPAAAEALAGEALAALDGPPWGARPHYARGRALLTRAAAEVALGRAEAAAATLVRAQDELRAVYGDRHALIADVLRRRAALDLDAGQLGLALERLYDALAVATLATAPEITWRVEDELARALAVAGRPRAAAAMGKLAVNGLQALRAGLTGLSGALQRSYLADRTAPYRRLAALLVDAGRVMEAQLVLDMLKDEEDFAFTRATRGSGRAPLSAREEAVHSATAAGPEPGQREALEKALRAFKRQVSAALAAADEDDTRTQLALEGRLDQLSLDRLDDLRAFLEDPPIVASGAAFLQIFLSDQRVRLILTLPGVEPRLYDAAVPVKRLYTLISRLRELLQDEASDPRPTARELYDALLRPVRGALDAAGAKTLMVWLDGALRYVPLAALHDGSGWLVERFRLAQYTPVTHSALKDRRQAAWRLTALGMSQAAPGFDPLPGVPGELDAIVAREGQAGDAGAMPGTVLLDGAFTAAALQRALQDGRLQAVHVASHYAFDPEGEDGSFLLLGDKSHLSLKKIRAIARRGRLALLTFSACNTAVGLGALDAAESSNDPLGLEVEGLANVAQRQLSSAVLASLWPVVDKSTTAFMRELYGALQADPELTKAEAVQRAQLRLLRGEVTDGHPKSWSHPRFWAPFVLMGNWR